MKNNILKSFIFLLILVFILLILSHIFNPKNNSEEFGMHETRANGILGEKEDTIDIVVVGDSETYTSIIPMELWKNYGFTSYICGTPAQALPESLRFAYTVTKNQKPKIIILEADNICKEEPLTAPLAKIAKCSFPVVEYHDRWKSLNINDFFGKIDYTWTDDMKGYKYEKASCRADSSNYMTYTTEKEEIPKENQVYVKILEKFCEINGIKFIVVSTPSTRNWSYKKHNSIESFTEKEKIEFVDLNLLPNEVQIDWNNDSRDEGDHLNHFGALKVTRYLGKYLHNKNILKDHRDDKKYEKWNESLKRYEDMVNK